MSRSSIRHDFRMLLEARGDQRLQLHLTEEDFIAHWAHLDPKKAGEFQRLESEYIQRAQSDAVISELAEWELKTVSDQLRQAGLLRDGHPIAEESAREWEEYQSYEQTDALRILKKRWHACFHTILGILSVSSCRHGWTCLALMLRPNSTANIRSSAVLTIRNRTTSTRWPNMDERRGGRGSRCSSRGGKWRLIKSWGGAGSARKG